MATAPITEVREKLYRVHLADAFEWLGKQRRNSIHAVVTDPPYGLLEYHPKDLAKMKAGRGGVWRIPPSFDGAKRRPLPRFTVLTRRDKEALREFFRQFAQPLLHTVSFDVLERLAIDTRRPAIN